MSRTRNALALLILIAIAWAGPARAVTNPSFIHLMSDDQSPRTVSAYGTTGENFLAGVVGTPNIDRIATAGARYTNYTTPHSTCAPSRAAILMSRMWPSSGITDTGGPLEQVNSANVSLPDVLKAAGYKVLLVGKYNLVGASIPLGGENPEAIGIDYYDICPPGTSQCLYTNATAASTMVTNYSHPGSGCPGSGSSGSPHSRTVTDYNAGLLATCTVNWWTANCLGGSDKCAAFVWFKGPHDPFDYEDANAGLASGTIATPTTFADDESGRNAAVQPSNYVTRLVSRFTNTWQPWAVSGLWHKLLYSGAANDADRAAFQYQQEVKDYLRALRSVDTAVGTILDMLDANPTVQARTLVTFTGDNGYLLGDHGGRAGKNNMYEQSLLVPHLMMLPSGDADAITAGSVVTAPTNHLDYAPTVVDYADLSPGAGWAGASMKPLMDGTVSPAWRDTIYYDFYTDGGNGNTYGVRSTTDKLVCWKYPAPNAAGVGPPECEYINLATDPHERTDQIANAAYANRIAYLRSAMNSWRVYHGMVSAMRGSVPAGVELR